MPGSAGVSPRTSPPVTAGASRCAPAPLPRCCAYRGQAGAGGALPARPRAAALVLALRPRLSPRRCRAALSPRCALPGSCTALASPHRFRRCGAAGAGLQVRGCGCGAAGAGLRERGAAGRGARCDAMAAALHRTAGRSHPRNAAAAGAGRGRSGAGPCGAAGEAEGTPGLRGKRSCWRSRGVRKPRD